MGTGVADMHKRKRPREEGKTVAPTDEQPSQSPIADERAVDAARTLELEQKLASMEAVEAELDECMRQYGIHLREMQARVSHRILRVHASTLYEPAGEAASDR